MARNTAVIYIILTVAINLNYNKANLGYNSTNLGRILLSSKSRIIRSPQVRRPGVSTESPTITNSVVRFLKSTVLDIPEDADLSITSLISKYRYPVEVHNVSTEDGYRLTLHRIPRSARNSRNEQTRQVVLLIHGLLTSSDDWILLGPKKSLGYLLSDEGYDVWMGNVRGNKHSRWHIIHSPLQSEFWDFSLDEIALYDLPAMIDYILEKTGSTQLNYIGHSQGTTLLVILCSRKKGYNDKINLAVLLAPVAWISNSKSQFLNIILKMSSSLHLLSFVFSNGELLASGYFKSFLGELTCNSRVPTQTICSNLLFQISGYDEDQLNVTMLPVILSHSPAGCSTKQVAHYGQIYRTGVFGSYDYSQTENIALYGTPTPPEYHIEDITTPIMLAYGNNDFISTIEDVDKLYHRLQHVIETYLVPDLKFSHVDFIWANDAKTLIYDKVISTLKNHSSSDTIAPTTTL